MKHSLAIAALVIASFSAFALPSYAQQADATVKPAAREIHRNFDRKAVPARGGAGFLGVMCSPRGAEALEVALVRLSHQLDLTEAQKPLFDTFKANALTTQTSYADSCQDALPAKNADAKPDLLERLKSGLAREEARIEAMNTILPDFEAFYTSLTDSQKASLTPKRGGFRDNGHGDRYGRGDGPDRNAPGRTHRLPAPGR